jgi:predicted nucleic acid-binding protein
LSLTWPPSGADGTAVAVVIDASGMVIALLGKSPEAAALRRRLGAEVCHAPHLIDAEVGNVLRRHVLRGALAAADAEALLHASVPLVDHRHEMTGALATAAWALRSNVTFYDGLYVALAVALAAPLLTADERLSRAPVLGCAVELVGAT